MSPSAQPVRLPSGVRDLLPRAAARRRAIADALVEVFEQWGYERLITPVVEVAEVLDRGLGDAGREDAIRFVEPLTGDVVALRPDITPQIARIAATRMAAAPMPSRLCYEGPVTRLNKRAGGQREILQAGIELIDSPSPGGDAEALAVAAAALSATRLREVRLDVGHVAFSRFALRHAAAEEASSLQAALARKDRSAVAELCRAMPRSVRAIATALPTLFGARDEIMQRVLSLRLPAELAAAVREVDEVLALAADQMSRRDHQRISLDFGEVRGFDYYTGLRFRGFAHGVGHAVLRGGRYDELVGRYGRSAAATGFSIDVESVAEAQDNAGIAAPVARRGLFIAATPRVRRAAQRMAAGLRERGHRVLVETHPDADISAVVDYARTAGWPDALWWDGGEWQTTSRRTPRLRSALHNASRGHTDELARWLEQGA